MKSLLGKISKIQSKVVVSKEGVNPHFKSKYITLEAIVNVVDPLMRGEGLVVTHACKGGLLTTTIHEIDSGDSLSSEFPVNTTAKPQEVGSTFSYAKRYNLSSLLNIVADRDTDAEESEGRGASVTKEKTTEPQNPTTAPKKVSFAKKAFTKPTPVATTTDDL